MSNENLNIKKTTKLCANIYVAKLMGHCLESDITPFEIEIAALESMGLFARKQGGSLSAIVEYPLTDDPTAILRAHYESLKNEDIQNYEMLCDGIDPYVEPIHPPSPGKWYADRADSFETFVGLCIEQAEKRMPTDERNEVPESVSGGRTIVARCVIDYEKFVKGVLTFDPESIAHRALLISGIVQIDGIELKATVFKSHRNGEVFDSKQQFAEQRKAFMWGIPRDEAISKLGWDIAQRAKTGHQFMKMCAEAAVAEMNAERLDKFHAKLEAVGCP